MGTDLASLRVACVLLGLLLAFGTVELIAGPHDSMVPMIFVGFGILLAALLVEIPAYFIRRSLELTKGAPKEHGQDVSSPRSLSILRAWRSSAFSS